MQKQCNNYDCRFPEVNIFVKVRKKKKPQYHDDFCLVLYFFLSDLRGSQRQRNLTYLKSGALQCSIAEMYLFILLTPGCSILSLRCVLMRRGLEIDVLTSSQCSPRMKSWYEMRLPDSVRLWLHAFLSFNRSFWLAFGVPGFCGCFCFDQVKYHIIHHDSSYFYLV